jgi:hypothetical protein
MSLPLNPEMLAAAYSYLSVTPPFNRWNLPDAEDIIFRINRSIDTQGYYCREGKRHVISISTRRTGRSSSLIEVMAHEMIHLHQRDVQMDSPTAQHNAAFLKIAARVCHIHGFDLKLF